MQDPNEDTEWNDVLRSKGIIGPKKEEITEDDIVDLLESTVQSKSNGKEMGDMDLDELNDIEDEIDEEEERIFEQYKRQRMAQMKAAASKTQFGSVLEITKADYVQEVNKAGEGIWVIVHVYKNSIPMCKLINQHLSRLAQKFSSTKFVKSISELCIPNYPDKNLPTLFVYRDGEMKKQWVGPLSMGGMNLTADALEWMLSELGAVQTELEENPVKKVHDVMESGIRSCLSEHTAQEDDRNDW